MKKPKQPEPASLNEIIDELTAEAGTDDERIWNFQQALRKHISLPCDGSVIGEKVTVIEFLYDGNPRRAVTARCRRPDGREYEVAVSDVLIPAATRGSQYLAAYRQWMELEPHPPAKRRAREKALPEDAEASIDVSGPVDLIVLSVGQNAARCRMLRSNDTITLRTGRLWNAIPGEIATVRPRKQWKYAGTPYLSGIIESTRIDAAALGLVPLKLEDRGAWDPAEQYWGEESEPIDEWAKPVIARGPRRQFEMEQVLPGADPGDPWSDPITDSNDRKDSGDAEGAFRILMQVCQADLRCLDAHAHLGNFAFDAWPEIAVRHYEAGFRIGELSLGRGFDGVLPWGRIDNRPFLRCMHGFGLCLWRLDWFEEATRIFDRMLWLNPSDNQGVRFLTDEVQAKVPWNDRRDK
jgi:hypothetical protein